MLNLLLAGMLLGASYLYTRNLCFPISLHLFWNWIQGPILGYQVSGNNFTTSMLTLRMPEENVLLLAEPSVLKARSFAQYL